MNELTAELESLASEVQKELGGLSDEQFNWKPAPDSWSVGQCIEHLVIANKKEILAMEDAVAGKHVATIWERLPFLPAFFGKLVIKTVDPANVKKNKAPSVFQPMNSDLSKGFIDEYIASSETIRKFINVCENDGIEKTIITSPVAKFVTYSLSDAFTLIVLHDRRHFNQAKRVIELDGFPE